MNVASNNYPHPSLPYKFFHAFASAAIRTTATLRYAHSKTPLLLVILLIAILTIPLTSSAQSSPASERTISATSPSDTIIQIFTDIVEGGDTILYPADNGRSRPIPAIADTLPTSESSETLISRLIRAEESQHRQEPVDTNRNWWHLMWKGKLSMQDTTVQYPRFLKFCVNVYNWADRVFNSYDTTYVVGFGRRWKTRIMFDSWADSYNMNLGGRMPITLISNPYSSAAIYLQYMAVSVNYGVDLNNLMFNKPVNHRKFEFGFNCARFNLDLAFNKNIGGSYIRTFGNYHRHKLLKEYMPGLSMESFTADLYYYFNNFKYANGAAYYFSKYQKRSAGSFILGFTFSYEDISMDFTTIPDNLKPYLTIDAQKYRFNYYNYCLLFGYGYNWVLNKHFLYNISVMPSVGVLHATEQSYSGSAKLLSLNLKGRMSLTYNKGDFFTCLIAKTDGHWYKTGKLSVFSAIHNISLSVGIRF